MNLGSLRCLMSRVNTKFNGQISDRFLPTRVGGYSVVGSSEVETKEIDCIAAQYLLLL